VRRLHGPQGGALRFGQRHRRRVARAVRPELAMASVGQESKYGQPGSETLGLLAGSRMPLLRTDRYGIIVVECGGRRW
jgi:beta-lactamase superfamily II metal-dependent hydrolase